MLKRRAISATDDFSDLLLGEGGIGGDCEATGNHRFNHLSGVLGSPDGPDQKSAGSGSGWNPDSQPAAERAAGAMQR